MNITTFSAFRSRNYRLFFTGQSVSLLGTWMQKTAVSWVVYDLTKSKWMLGVSLFATMFPSFVFSFLGGVAADRYNRHKLLLITQVVSMLQALALTVLVYFKVYTVWEILGLSVVLGIVNAFDVPARQSLVYEMVDDKKDLPNALALNSSMVNLSRLIGPGIAGLAMEYLGTDVCFGLNAASFIAVIASLLMMKLPQRENSLRNKGGIGQLKEGFAYIKATPAIATVLLILAFNSLFVLPFATLIPVYAKDIFHGTASTFGAIDSAIGLGAICGGLYLASLKPGHDMRKIMAIDSFIFGAGLILFSHTTIYLLALAFAVIAAFGMMGQVTMANTIIQTTVTPEMRGRVISFYAMAFFGLQPVGGLIIGFLSQYTGVENMVLAQGIISLIIGYSYFHYIKKQNITTRLQQIVVTSSPKSIL
ncbi:Predicted arabinose efflux permease, MFS family [Chitinophaga costaii]|uniref:Predicted arabinose efflux permease, MFS family n=1 Tax=Chitinophaga costaii TaxID=1335309 RepID=A0A1C4D8B0_9BACT|nr:MFS transporter [Chitinophaga costaii]PUZ24502.1 MFS transporter [Chitinophaga costaii]SCC27563.1 Predicted arabinose efflux permease, MFS family [Chitinophaga costaii]